MPLDQSLNSNTRRPGKRSAGGFISLRDTQRQSILEARRDNHHGDRQALGQACRD